MPEFGRRGAGGREFLIHQRHDAAIKMRPADLQLGPEIRQYKTRVLKFQQGFVESSALFHILDSDVVGMLGGSLRAHGDRQPLLRQFLHHVDEALILRAKQVVRRHPHILQKDFRDIR